MQRIRVFYNLALDVRSNAEPVSGNSKVMLFLVGATSSSCGEGDAVGSPPPG